MLSIRSTTEDHWRLQPLPVDAPTTGKTPLCVDPGKGAALLLFSAGSRLGGAVSFNPGVQGSASADRLLPGLCSEISAGSGKCEAIICCSSPGLSIVARIAENLDGLQVEHRVLDLGKMERPRCVLLPNKAIVAMIGQPLAATAKEKIKASHHALSPLGNDDKALDIFRHGMQTINTTATKFFRDDELFNCAAKMVIPSFVANDKRGVLNVWSAGCSTGEEPYSIAMAMAHECERKRHAIGLQIFGTDINNEHLSFASRGTYNWPERTPPLAGEKLSIFKRYFSVANNTAQATPELRKLLRFGPHDLRIPPKVHVFFFIVCNHVLQYYECDGQISIVKNLLASLAPGGYLYLHGAHWSVIEASGLQRLPSCRCVYVRKQNN